MMRFILLLLVLAGSVWLGIHIQQDPGYVLLAYKLWTVEMPLWVAIIVLLVLFAVGYGLLRIIGATGALGGRMRAWATQRRLQKARLRTYRGLQALAEGHWKAAEKDLAQAATVSDMTVWNYLTAAWAAQAQHDLTQRDGYIQDAYLADPNASLAIRLTHARLQIKAQQWAEASNTLQELRIQAPKNCLVLQLIATVYQAQQEWQALLVLLTEIRKLQCYGAEEFAALQKSVYYNSLAQNIAQTSLATLQAYWRQLPKELQKDNDIIYLYTSALIQQNASAEAEQRLRDALNKQWDDSLVTLYGLVKAQNQVKQLAIAEGWLKTQPKSAALLLALARICLRNQLWGKARDYLESYLIIQPHPEAYRLLGELLDQLGDKQASAACYQKGLLALTASSLTTTQ